MIWIRLALLVQVTFLLLNLITVTRAAEGGFRDASYGEDGKSRSLVFGGSKVESESKYPYFGVLLGTREYENEFKNETLRTTILCGGSLISGDVLLTIGRCVNYTDLIEMHVIFETLTVSDRERQVIQATSWMFDESEGDDKSLGLVFLESEADGISPVNVAIDPVTPAMNEAVKIMGFGVTENSNDTNSDYLMDVEILVNDTATCDLDYDETFDDSHQFCAGGVVNGTREGACLGDSGGPAIDRNGDVVGVVSFGIVDCGIYPTIFTRVSGYTNFLKAYVCGREGTADPAWCNSEPPSSGGFFACFDGSGKVEVQGKDGRTKKIAMKELSIGDNINVGNNIFEPVYSFGHRSPSAKADMLEIKTDLKSTLRLSPNHMLMVATKGTIPASQVEVGDQVLTSSGNAESIEKIINVVGRGLYAPFTPSGKIVVDGILASSYIALEDSKGLELMGGWLKVDHQWMAHAGSFPHRMVCYYSAMRSGSNYCEDEKYSSEGISEGVHGSLLFYNGIFETANNCGPLIRGVFFATVLVGLVAFSLVEAFIVNPVFLLVASTLLIMIVTKFCTKRLNAVS